VICSASLGTESESENPWKAAFSGETPSDAITLVWPMRKQACRILFSKPGGTLPGACGFRAFVVTHYHLDFGAECVAIESNCLLAAAIEEQIWFDGSVVFYTHGSWLV